jgi:hypothetical protein
MRSKVLVFAAALALAATGLAQTKKNDHDADDKAGQAKAARAQAVKITKGPIIEEVTDHSATFAWSTNVRSSGVIRYGSENNKENQTAEAPYGGPTHRVHLKNLKPGTKYYFVLDSGQGAGTGTEAKSQEMSFTTQAKGQKHAKYEKPGPGQ